VVPLLPTALQNLVQYKSILDNNVLLFQAVLKTASDDSCDVVYGSTYSPSSSVCANGVTGSSCQGDSGSFVGAVRGRRMEIVGMVSFGAKDRCDKYPMGLADVYAYNSWIVGVVNKYDNYVV
jgi:secreted trypsin-like serine protease